MEITHAVKHQDTGKRVKHTFFIEDTVGAFQAAHGEEVTYSLLMAAVKTQANSRLAGLTHGENKAGETLAKSAEDALKEMESYTPRVYGSRRGKPPVDKLAAILKGRSQDEMKALYEDAMRANAEAEAEAKDAAA